MTATPARASAPSLPGIAPAVAARLATLGIARAFDLVLHLPLRYEDETRVWSMAEAPMGAPTQVEGVVFDAEVRVRGRRQLVARVRDDTGQLFVRLLHFYPNQQKQLAAGQRVRLVGEIRPGFDGPEMVHPRVRPVSESAPLPDRLTPVYPTTAGLSQHALRSAVHGALARSPLDETLPAGLLARLRLPGFEAAVRLLHDPPAAVDAADLESRRHPAWRRMKFDELLAQQLSMRLHRRQRDTARAPRISGAGELSGRLFASLPFGLTGAQQRVLAEIRADLAKPHPMQRLLQGDVGSGKTIVAAAAALGAIGAGYQVAVMAPTEILAEQHQAKFRQWLEPLGISVAWLAGGLGARERRAALAAVESGTAAVAVGTHALFQKEVVFARLALAIVDEQHRFGVRQRLALRHKGADGDEIPHQLMMSATPIPRTLAMSYYADLDVSVIDEMPPGRTPVVTKLVSEARRDDVLHLVRDTCAGANQVYWVCPLIEDPGAVAPAPPPTARARTRAPAVPLELQNAIDTQARLAEALPELNVGLVHGRLKPDEKAAVMRAFQRGEVNVLVATTVIEVGVDVPAATLMVIEHAERMGLAQLHQLRGRVGRGGGESACVLLYQQPLSETARARLRTIYEHTDGFAIAREDLRQRGPGELLGSRQSGVPMLRFADPEADADLLEAARAAADTLLREAPEAARRHVERWLGGREELLRV